MKKFDIQIIQVSMYPKKMDIHVSKYPCIQVCMISKYPIIQVSKKKSVSKISMYPDIRKKWYPLIPSSDSCAAVKNAKFWSILNKYLALLSGQGFIDISLVMRFPLQKSVLGACVLLSRIHPSPSTSPLWTDLVKILARKLRHASSFSLECTDFKNVFFEKNP